MRVSAVTFAVTYYTLVVCFGACMLYCVNISMVLLVVWLFVGYVNSQCFLCDGGVSVSYGPFFLFGGLDFPVAMDTYSHHNQNEYDTEVLCSQPE